MGYCGTIKSHTDITDETDSHRLLILRINLITLTRGLFNLEYLSIDIELKITNRRKSV